MLSRHRYVVLAFTRDRGQSQAESGAKVGRCGPPQMSLAIILQHLLYGSRLIQIHIDTGVGKDSEQISDDRSKAKNRAVYVATFACYLLREKGLPSTRELATHRPFKV